MPLIDRYLLQEIFKTLLAILVVILLIFMGSTFIKLLKEVSLGDLNVTLLFQILGLEMSRLMSGLIPPTFFFAVLYALGRMYRDSEIIAMEACGVGGPRLFRSILIATLPLSLLVGWFSMGVAPWSARMAADLRGSQQGHEAEIAGIGSGRFNESSQGNRIIYVESKGGAGEWMQNIFVQYRGKKGVDLITAARAYQRFDPESGGRYMVLEDGYRYQGIPGMANFRVSEFSRYDLSIKDSVPALAKKPWKGYPNLVLWMSDDIRHKTELQIRLSRIMSLLVVALLALPLSRSTPRQSPYGRLVVAFVFYTLYLSMQGLSEKWMVDGVTPIWLGLWWVHLSLALVALTLFLPDSTSVKRWRRRMRRA